ncbi:MAG: ribonuclease P protein component [Thermogutta sp.]
MKARSDSRLQPPTDQSFPKALRLRKRREFDRVFAEKCSVSGTCFVIYARENEHGYSRLGLVVSAKCGKSVLRNRWKRLMREVFRLQRGRIRAGLDLVMIPRRGAEPDFTVMMREFPGLIRRLIDKLRRRALASGREAGEG